PRLEGVQRVFLYRNPGEAWKTAVDFRLNVQDGRVDRFYVVADESYSLVPDSASNFIATETTLETGERAFVFQPKKTPLEGRAEFVFVATAENNRENVRLPRFRLVPSSPREDVSGVRRFAFLPQRFDATALRWATENLRPVERDEFPQTALEDATREMTRGTAALAAGGALNDSFVVPPAILTNDSGMSSPDFSVYETLADDADAWIASENDRLQISRAASSFYVNARREIFVASTFSLRPNAPSSCVLIVPEKSRVLKATVNGSPRRVAPLGDGRWSIDLDATRFGKRLEVAVQIPAPDATANAKRSFFASRSTAFELVAPRVEGAAPEKTTWFCAFEPFADAAPRWRVRQIDVGESPDAPARPAALLAPVRYADANELLFRLCVDDASALLAELESDAALFANARADEFERRRARWNRAWRQNEQKIARFVAPDQLANALDDAQRDAFLAVAADRSASASSPLENGSNARLREIIELKSKLDETYRFAPAPDEATEVAPELLWAVGRALDARVLAGWTDARLDRVVVVAPAKRFDFVASRYASALFVLAATAIALRLLRSSLKSPRFQRALFAALGSVAAFAFFALAWRALGLTLVLCLALLPPLLEATRRRSAFPERSSNDETPTPASNAPIDVETTASLFVARRPDAAETTLAKSADDERR
ncbi:MAG: hypothetical protein IJE97_04555, partial [Thermoguttaceae bacterium]|nr:hypothetical protein [Thermoguttaceae bacterium]